MALTSKESDIYAREINILRANYHKTARTGDTTAPTRELLKWLDSRPRIKGKIRNVLDFGAGRGRDTVVLSDPFAYTGFDPHAEFGHTSEFMELRPHYDLVVCNYVLNVVVKQDRELVIKSLIQFLKSGALILIGVREDVGNIKENWNKFYEKNGKFDGYITRRTTFQHFFRTSEVFSLFNRHATVEKIYWRGGYVLIPKDNNENKSLKRFL